ncbi:MAG: HAMP domain-containing sensor histidine kinase [Candidatus Gracilibacteria bacterium]|nr:HAMP domain-containing sensor histidine kinase [Candidatus Gracilibacteria bacterium]
MEEFIQNAGHELKTPISIIHSNLQLIKAEKKYDKNLIIENIEELEKFNNLIDGLTELSGINLNIKKIKINLKKEIPEIIAENIKSIKIKKIKIKYIFKNNIKIIASKEHFKILFSNLLNNAIKYNKIGGEIKITINKNKLIIKDTGIGVTQINLEKIFDRFYRENNSQTGDGFGIGLSLVSKICEINKWKISVNSQKGEGTSFEIKF